MKIIEKTSFFRKQFEKIIKDYNYTLEIKSNYYIEIYNNSTIIKFMTFRDEEGIGIYIRNKSTNLSYDLIDLHTKKGIAFKSYLSELEIIEMNELQSDAEKAILISSLFFERCCKDILRGDFSIMEIT